MSLSRADRIDQAVAQMEAGSPIATIAEVIGVTRSTVKGYLTEAAHCRAQREWTRGEILDRIKDWCARYGTPPTSYARCADDVGWSQLSPGHCWQYETIFTHDGSSWPTTTAVGAFFDAVYEPESDTYWGSLDVAIKLAGFEPERLETPETERWSRFVGRDESVRTIVAILSRVLGGSHAASIEVLRRLVAEDDETDGQGWRDAYVGNPARFSFDERVSVRHLVREMNTSRVGARA